MPRLTLQCGGALLENVTGPKFFPPLFDELSKEPTINRDLLKGFIRKEDDFFVGPYQLLLPSFQLSFVHLEMAVLDNRRSDEVLDKLAECIANYTRDYFCQSLADQKNSCYITSDIRLIKARWHRSVARGKKSLTSVHNSRLPFSTEQSACSQKILSQPVSQYHSPRVIPLRAEISQRKFPRGFAHLIKV